jgi:hypothetical protein
MRHDGTSLVERQNLTMRMSIRRFTRLTNAFSKKVENHRAAVALHFMHYNFCQVHQTLREMPAMEAGISSHLWSIVESWACSTRPTRKRVNSRLRMKLETGTRVVLKELPAGLLDGLPAIDQDAIKSIVGKQVTFVDCDGDGRAQLEFVDVQGNYHSIWVEPRFVFPSS